MPTVSPLVILSVYLDPRWSGHSACPFEPLSTLSQHEASLGVEPSGLAWRNSVLFCPVPGGVREPVQEPRVDPQQLVLAH